MAKEQHFPTECVRCSDYAQRLHIRRFTDRRVLPRDHSGRYKIVLNKELLNLFDAGYTQVQWEQRRQLSRKPRLLSYYSSHRAAHPVKVQTLQTMCGSSTASLQKFRRNLRKALDEVRERDILSDWIIDADDKVTVTRPD
jgi:hypothetical protein